MRRCIFITQVFLIALLLTQRSNAEIINFNSSDYEFDKLKQEVRLHKNKNVTEKYYQNFKVPLTTETQTNLYSVPTKMQIIKTKTKPILTGLGYSDRSKDSLKVYENYSNVPAAIASSGFARGNGILNLEFSPFIFSNDTLYFVQSVEYKLTDYQLPLVPNGKLSEETDLLIIGSESSAMPLEKYRRFKQENGIKTQIAYTEVINNTIPGNNLAHKIRNYIKQAYRNQKIKFVLLAGSTNVIPAVTFRNNFEELTENVACDQFYSNLDKEFDSNNNGLYGDSEDLVDFYPDVFIGRWPGSITSEIEAMVNKSIRYSDGTISTINNYYQSLLLIGFKLYNPYDSEVYMEMVKQTTAANLQADSLYEYRTPNFSQNYVYSHINQGYNIVYAQAHGNINKFGVRNGWGIYSDHLYYTNATSGLYLIASCHPGDFASFGLVTKSLLSPTGGCINYIGASAQEFPAMSQLAHKNILLNLINHYPIGEALCSARITGFPNLVNSSTTRELYYGYNLNGDPSNWLFMQTPQTINLTNISTIKKGTGSVTGNLDVLPQNPITVTLSSAKGILAKTTTSNNFFSLSYENLFEDSVVISISSPSAFFKKVTKPTIVGNQELQVKKVSIIDNNNSGIVENMDPFKISIELLSTVNHPSTDLLKVVFNCKSSTLNLVDSANINYPTTGTIGTYQLFNFTPDLSTLKNDTSLVFTIRIVPASKQQSQSIFERKYLLPVANPKLEISWSKFVQPNKITPVLLNKSAGKINQAIVNLAYQNGSAVSSSSSFMFKNILGNALLTDSLQFIANLDSVYRLKITQNNSNSYFSNIFKKSSETSALVNSINLSSYPVGRNLTLAWNRLPENILYNIHIYTADTLASGITANVLPLTTNNFCYQQAENQPQNAYVKIGLVDKLTNEEFAVSRFIAINTIPQYKNAPYSLLPFHLYNPQRIDNKIIANTESGSIVSIPASGQNIVSNGSLYNSQTHGMQNDFLQGRAIGDLNNDTHKDIVTQTWCGYDSIYLQAVDLETGFLLAKKSIYGFGKLNTPVLVNIDSDPEQEVLISLFNGPQGDPSPKGAYIYAFDLNNGNFVLKSGYPLFSDNNSWDVGAPIVADLDNNGNLELVFNCGSYIEVYNLSNLSKITDFIMSNHLTGDLVTCDLDNDGKLEIICMQSNGDGAFIGKLRVLKFNDNTLTESAGFVNGIDLDTKKYNYNRPGATPMCVDMNMDGNPEIVTLTGKKLYVFTASGQAFANFPITLPESITDNNLSTPSLADLNGDGILDILFMDSNSQVHAYNGSNGLILPGFPFFVPDGKKNHFACLNISDLDNDGDLEILCGARAGQLYIYDYPVQTSTRQIYSFYRGDLSNSGKFSRSDTVGIPNSINTPTDLNILSQYPNPFNPSTAISFSIPKAEVVDFKVFNSSGQLVYQEKNNYREAGIKTINFNGSKLSSGLYIYSIKCGKDIRIGKCALLK